MDWPGLIQAGLRHLRLTPTQFWALTPAELQVMLGLTKTVMPLDRKQFDSLLQAFPDKMKDETNG